MSSEQEIEAAARAMELSAFATYDRGYTCQNALAERAFLNSERTVRLARRKAKLGLEAAEQVQAAEHVKAMAGFSDETIAELKNNSVHT